MKSALTVDRLRELMNYDPETGLFTRKITAGPMLPGSIAGGQRFGGYIQIAVDGRLHRAHRLAWLYVHGAWPDGQLDHIDSNRANNRICNLRQASPSQNGGNMRLHAKNTTRFKGVVWRKTSNRYIAQIGHKNRKLYLGVFKTPEEAHAAYLAAAVEYFGEFARAS